MGAVALAPAVPFRVTDDGVLQFWDGSCTTCASCVAGFPAWCSYWSGPRDAVDRISWQPLGDGFDPASTGFGGLSEAATCLDLVTTGQFADATVLLLGCGPGALRAKEILEASGVALVAVLPETPTAPAGRPDPALAAVRETFAKAGRSGRADLVVAFDGRLDAAARLVRRGGAVATTQSDPTLPKLDTLVAREVCILPPKDPVGSLARLDLTSLKPNASETS